MPSQMITWNALPNGLAGPLEGRRVYRLSVFVAPRLRATPAEGDTLKLWPDFIDWPERMRTVNFKVQFTGGPTLDATVDRSKLDSTLWRALFNQNTFVRAHTFDNYAGRSIISYPARRVYEGIRETYLATGNFMPDGWGEFTNEDFYPFGFEQWLVNWNAATEAGARSNLELPAAEMSDTGVTARLLLFHRRPAENPVQLPADPAGHERTLDFHQALSALGDYPELLRRLGLVLDIVVPQGSIPSTVTAVQVIPTLTPAPGTVTRTNRTPKTAIVLDNSRFHAASKNGEIVDGLLALDEDEYNLIPLDLDGAALKLVNTGLSAARHEHNRFGDGPPTLRSAGIALVQEDQALKTVSHFIKAQGMNSTLESGGEITLFADDLVHGLRMDVWEERTGTWRSLCRRNGTYVFESINRTETILDEGWIEPAMTEAANPKPGALKDLYLHEAVAHWEGFSAVASRPGRAGSADSSATPGEVENDPLTAFKLRVNVGPTPGSLPVLRFGGEYRVRARVVDPAGNSVSLEDAPDIGLPAAPRAFAYLRYQRIAPPVLVPRAPLGQAATPGESVDRLVLRTANTDPAKDSAVSPALAERHAVPDRVNVPLAETNGALDGPGGKPRADLYAVLKEKDAGELRLDPATGKPVEPAAQAPLPYLPDQLSRGSALRGLPGTAAGTAGRIDAATGKLVYTPDDDHPRRGPAVTLLDWGVNAAWPNYQPFRIVLRDGNGPPVWDRPTRVLTVFLPKGATARVPLSSYLKKDDLKLMGIWEWLREDAEQRIAQALTPLDGNEVDSVASIAFQLARQAQLAVEGGHALLTPSRKVELIHAVQQPLGRPSWRRLTASRPKGSTVTAFNGELQIHGATTANVALRARWEEQVDLLTEPGPRQRVNDAVVTDLRIPAASERRTDDQPVTIKAKGKDVARYVFDDDRLLFALGIAPRHTLEDTKHHTIRYKAVSTSRYREFFPPTAPGGFTRESDEIIISLPSTARPAPPRLLYILPTWGWERQTDTNLVASRRRGRGVRAYFDRPWFSSGDGELLGVVGGFGNFEDERVKPYISQFGNDPVVLGTRDPAFFARFEGSGSSEPVQLTLEELPPGEEVQVNAFPVQYDVERKLWYCDFQFDPSGFPSLPDDTNAWNAFARLSLVRYQPNALPGCELSRPVVADFVQTAPDRYAVATSDPYDRGLVRLTVAGGTLRAKQSLFGVAVPEGTSVEVRVETRRPDVEGELGWMPAPPNVAAVTQEASQPAGSGQLLWSGRITLPADRAPGQFRVMIREFEPWLDDASLAAEGINPLNRPRRLIYAETLVLA